MHPLDFSTRVQTRLAWLHLRQVDLAEIICMDKTCLSRALRAVRPRDWTVERIALGLGLSREELLSSDASPLTREHPALLGMSADGAPRDARVRVAMRWYEERIAGVSRGGSP